MAQSSGEIPCMRNFAGELEGNNLKLFHNETDPNPYFTINMHTVHNPNPYFYMVIEII